MSKEKIVLSVPPIAIGVDFEWEISPPEGRVMLYRTITDPKPQILNGPSGAGHSDLAEPATLYYEMLSGTKTFNFFTKGFRMPGNLS